MMYLKFPRTFIAGIASNGIEILAALFLQAAFLFHPGHSTAQDLPPPEDDIPFIDDFQIPEAQAGDLVLPDEDLPVSDAEARKFGDAMLANQAKVYDDLLRLELALKERVESKIPELGRRRVEEIKAALSLPEKSGERIWRLKKLNAKAFMALPKWDTESGIQIIGEALFLDRVNKGGNWIDEFRVVIPGVGFAEPKLVGGKLYPRMVDESTGSSHFFLESELEVDSPEWKRYTARVRAWANRGRGRPQVFWVIHRPTVEGDPAQGSIRVKFFDRPSGKREQLTNWWNAVYVKPDQQAFVQAGIKTVLEVGSAELLTFLISGGHVDHTFTKLTIGYALALGIYGSTVRNAFSPVDPTSFWERTYKMALRLLVTSYSFGAWNKALRNGIESVSWFTPTGRSMNLEIMQNSLASNLLKDGFNSLSDVREATGHARYSVQVPLTGVKLKGTQLERTLWYQIPNNLKNADLLTLNSPANALPHFLFYSAIIATPIAVWKHAQAIKYDQEASLPAARLARFMDDLSLATGLLATDPRTYGPLIAKVIANQTLETILNCVDALKFKKPEEAPSNAPPFEASSHGAWTEIRLKP
ncbi:MAG: hypothetical protein KGP28_05665 [Bdellovibrionales bacterium]|nr:hypothetical protein [Bdellovibrionales bacterium]